MSDAETAELTDDDDDHDHDEHHDGDDDDDKDVYEVYFSMCVCGGTHLSRRRLHASRIRRLKSAALQTRRYTSSPKEEV